MHLPAQHPARGPDSPGPSLGGHSPSAKRLCPGPVRARRRRTLSLGRVPHSSKHCPHELPGLQATHSCRSASARSRNPKSCWHSDSLSPADSDHSPQTTVKCPAYGAPAQPPLPTRGLPCLSRSETAARSHDQRPVLKQRRQKVGAMGWGTQVLTPQNTDLILCPSRPQAVLWTGGVKAPTPTLTARREQRLNWTPHQEKGPQPCRPG